MSTKLKLIQVNGTFKFVRQIGLTEWAWRYTDPSRWQDKTPPWEMN